MGTLADEIADDPLGLGYAAYLPDSPGVVADMLNAQTQTAVQSRFVTARTVLNELDDGAVILDKLEAAAAGNGPLASPVKWAMRFMTSSAEGAGVDVGAARTRGLLDGLVAAGVLTTGEANAVKAMAIQPCSRAHVLGLIVNEADVRAALES